MIVGVPGAWMDHLVTSKSMVVCDLLVYLLNLVSTLFIIND